MNLSLPLLLARKREKKMEKLLDFMKIFLVSSLVIAVVFLACLARFLTEVADRNDINLADYSFITSLIILGVLRKGRTSWLI